MSDLDDLANAAESPQRQAVRVVERVVYVQATKPNGGGVFFRLIGAIAAIVAILGMSAYLICSRLPPKTDVAIHIPAVAKIFGTLPSDHVATVGMLAFIGGTIAFAAIRMMNWIFKGNG